MWSRLKNLSRKIPPFSLLLLILVVGGVMRFWKFDWGEGYLFHPDEYHIAAAVNRISFPDQMNPHFFSYGSLIIYLIYFTRGFLSLIGVESNNNFLQAIMIGRFYSALFSTLTILVVFFISRKIFKTGPYPYIATFLTAILPGSIQQAHFATPESNLTFWLFLVLLFSLLWLEQKRLKFLYGAAVSLGLALGTKVVALTFWPVLVILPILSAGKNSVGRFSRLIKNYREALTTAVYLIKVLLIPTVIIGLTFFLVYPYSLLDYKDFRNSTNYEMGVGRGKPLVFYTRQFINTIPVVFQIEKIFPYALGLAVEILGIFGFLMILFSLLKNIFKKRFSILHSQFLILVLSFLLYFLPNAFLFAKWTRFVAPVLPFFTIFASYVISQIKNRFLLLSCYFLLATNVLWGLMFFSIYLRHDVRIQANDWINKNLSSNSVVFTEQGNMIEVPLSGGIRKTSMDFYALDENPQNQKQLPSLLTECDYFIVQSRRIFADHQRLPNLYPKTARFYDLLFSGALGFEEIKNFNSFPQLSVIGYKFSVNDEVGEETWSVFDHPVIRIYKKIRPLSEETYERLVGI